jgi:hypothetical protein
VLADLDRHRGADYHGLPGPAIRDSLSAMRCVFACAIVMAACGGGEPPADAGPTECPAMPPVEAGGDGHAAPLEAGPGQARAGRIAASDLPVDRNGLAVWEAGDFVLANDRVAILIEDAGESDLYDPYGGRPVGIARVAGGALVEAADFEEVLFGLGTHIVATTSVGVADDGADGSAAVVRAVGTLAPIDFLGDLVPVPLRGMLEGFPAAIDYTLEPDADVVAITLTVDVESPRGARAPLILNVFVQGYRMPLWTAASGFDDVGSEPQAFVAFDDAIATSYAWIAAPARPTSLVLDDTGVSLFNAGSLPLAACERVEVDVGSIAIGERFDDAQAIALRTGGATLRTIAGTVTESDGTPAEGVRVHATAGDGRHLSRQLTGADGRFSLTVPEGEALLSAWRRGFPIVGPIPAAAATDLAMPPRGFLEVRARDAGSGTPSPARVQAMPVAGSVEMPAASWGEEPWEANRADVRFAGADGLVRMTLPVGDWRIVVSRGYEFEIVDALVAISDGATATLDADLLHGVGSTGVVCADYHIHTARSPDSEDDARLKILALVGDGLEIGVRSEHEIVDGFDDVIVALGLEAFARGLDGLELSTFTWGHLGVFPLAVDASRPNGGAFRWQGRMPPEVFADVRARPETPALIINHPRTGSSFNGYFTAAQYDPVTGTVGIPALWDEAFSLVEAMNASSFDESRDGAVRDWLSLVAHGRRVFAVGSSDSHRVHRQPVGYPRTCLELGTDDPRAVTPAQIRDATIAGRSFVSGGIHLDVDAGGVGPGGEVTGVATASLHVIVRAATWIDVDELEVIVDGATAETIPITPADADPTDPTIRLDAMVEAPVAAGGSYVVIHASGTQSLAPVHDGRQPFAVTNPIFFRR